MGFAGNVQTKDAFSVAFLVTAKGTIEGGGGILGKGVLHLNYCLKFVK